MQLYRVRREDLTRLCKFVRQYESVETSNLGQLFYSDR